MTKSASGSELKKIQTVVVLGNKSSGVTSGGQEYSPVNPSVQEYSPINPSVQEYSPVNPSVHEYSPVNPSVQEYSPVNPSGVTSGGQRICGIWLCHMTLPDMAAVEVSPIGAGETFGLRYEGKIDLPKLMNRWNVEEMIKE